MKTQIKRLIVFNASFVMQFFAQGGNYAVTFLLMWVMITNFRTMNGWSAYEVMLLYAVNLTAYGFAGMFFYFFRFHTLQAIKTGAFDDALILPIRLLPYLIMRSQTPSYIIHLTLSMIMLAVCVSALSIQTTLLSILTLILTVFCGTLIYGAMFVFITAPAFLMTDADSLGSMLFFFRETSYYPLSIFPRFFQILMTVILPYGMINFFPLQPMLGKRDFLMFGSAFAYLAPVFAIAFFALSVWVFCICARRYQSTGS
jgi:ABC-2 type transport system permease protein